MIKPGDIAKIKAMGYNLQLLAGTIERYQKALQEISRLAHKETDAGGKAVFIAMEALKDDWQANRKAGR